MIVINRYIIILLTAFLLVCASSQTAKSDQSDEERQQLLMYYPPTDLHITTIATKTKIHSDLVPGTATVLLGDDLERKGVRTVGEALTLVPGIDFCIGMNGTATPSVRGVGLGSNRKIKALLNGVPINASLQGEVVPIYFIPIEQVERIEVIRGPGSAIYGKWAFLGTINVITRKNENRAFLRFGNFNARHGGLLVSYANEDKSLEASVNVAGWERESTDITSGPNQFAPPIPENVGGKVNDSRESPTEIATLKYKWLTLIGQDTATSFGSYYGIMGVFLPPYDNRRKQKEQIRTFETRIEPDLFESVAFKLNLGIKNYLWDSGKQWLYPETFGKSHYEDQSLYSNLNIHAHWEKHQMLLGLEYEKIAMHDVWIESNFDPSTGMPTEYQRYSGDQSWIEEGHQRDIYGIFIQDQIQATDLVTLTAGGRFDFYQDDENEYDRFSPRIAGVYTINRHHLLKAQYASAFRPPSFQDVYALNFVTGNPELEEETIDTYEFGYTYKNDYLETNLTFFFSELEDLITNYYNKISVNRGRGTLAGAESELQWQISNSFKCDANLSYVKTDDKTIDAEIGGGTNWLANLALIHQFRDDYFITGTYAFVGKRFRLPSDVRRNLKAYHRFGIVAGAENVIEKGLDFRVGVNNLFDNDIRYLSNYFFDDYKANGREFWAQASLRF